MTQEEKAKAYDKALELARVAAFNGHQSLMEGIFPELKESEDEKIRKQTLKVLNYYKDEEKAEDRMPIEIDECIAWLEKQGEQKHARSEEDEKTFVNLISYGSSKYIGEQVIEWLNSLKQRLKKEAV